MSKHYVVYWCEHLRDGIEEGAKVVSSLSAATDTMERILNGFGGRTTSVKLFELGNEIPLVEEVTEEPQPSVKTTTIKIKGQP